MPKTKANGVNLHYITVGAGSDFVTLHGFLGNLAVWHFLVHLRNDKDWIGWTPRVAKLEEVGIHVPEDQRADARVLLQYSLETPGFHGPARVAAQSRTIVAPDPQHHAFQRLRGGRGHDLGCRACY